MRKSIFVLLLLLVSSMTWAQAYKWRDANGRVQYSDTPPPAGTKDVQQLRKAPAGPSATGGVAGGKSPSEQDAEFRKRLAEKQEAETKQGKAAEEEQTKARNCEQAKGQLAALESGGRMAQFNDKGERLALDDADRERALQDSRKAVDTWCK